MANVVLTGVTGFIGSNLAKKLVDLGHRVFGVTRHCASRSLKPIEEILDDVVLVAADITDPMSISQALRSANPDCIFHLAALTPVRLSFEKPFEYERFNYLGTMNIVHSLMSLPDYEKRRIIVASTAEVYGYHEEEEKPLKEIALLNPSSPYAVSKAAADMYVRMASEVYNIDCVVLRPVNTYGRKFETNFLVEYVVTSMLRGENVYVGAPESIREYMYVDDHINAYVKAMEKGRKGQAYNIATGEGVKNRDLAEKIAEKVGYDKNRVVFDSYPPGYPLRPIAAEQPYIVLDSTKAERELNWSPQVSLSEGLHRTIQYWQDSITKTTAPLGSLER